MKEIPLRFTNEHIMSVRSEYAYTYQDYLKIYEEIECEEEVYI